MTTRKVIYPSEFFDNQLEETTVSDDPKIDAIRNCPAAVMPENTINTYAEQVRLMVIGAPDRSLILALHLTMPAPLGDIRCHLGREQILELHDHLVDLLNLTDEQTDALVERACQEQRGE